MSLYALRKVFEELSWQDAALCKETDPELFFPVQHNWLGAKHAKRVCGRCPAQNECLDYALDHPELEGIWGGLTHKERQVYRRDEQLVA